MVLNLLNLYSLIIALFDKISHMEQELKSLRPKESMSMLAMANFNITNCKNVPVPCSSMSEAEISSTLSSIAAKQPSKSTTFISSIAALSLILMPNATVRNSTFIDENAILPRLFSTTDEIQRGWDENYNHTSSSSISISETTSALPYVFDSDVKWESYDYSDVNDLIHDDDGHDVSTSTEITSTFDSSTEETYKSSSTTSNAKRETLSTRTSTADLPTRISTTDSPTSISTALPTRSSTLEQDTTIMTEINKITTPFINDVETVNWKKETNFIKCYIKVCDAPRNCRALDVAGNSHEYTSVSLNAISRLNMTTKRKLRRLCWETMFGQELAKLTVMDLMLTIIATLGVDFFRAIFVRYMNRWWCWDLEKQFPQYGDFKIAENILHLVNNQGLVWMGMFFSPGLTALNLLKLGILMYLRSWAVMTCNVPHEVVFRASRSNNFYLSLLLTMIFLCVLPVGYAIVWVEPSWHCGPFSGYYRIYHMATKSLKDALPNKVHKALDYIASPGIIIPLLVLMTLIIYYMVSLAGSLREANNDLKIQLRYERTEERRKMFKIAEKHGQAKQDNSFAKWRKILPIMPSSKNDTPVARAVGNIIQQKHRRAIDRIRSMTSEADEATDIEPNSALQDSLTQINVKEIDDDKDVTDASNSSTKGTKIPRIRIDEITTDSNIDCQPATDPKQTTKEDEREVLNVEN